MENGVFLTVGQMAKIHNINKRTLMYYDEIGLFSPAFKDLKGYRFYLYSQCSSLETILSLRGLDMPIEEIKEYMVTRSPERLLTLFEAKEKDARQKIEELEKVRSYLCKKSNSIKSSILTKMGEISITDSEEEYLLVSPILKEDSDEAVVTLMSSILKQLHNRHLYCHSYGSIISHEYFLANKFTNYTQYFLKVPKMMDHPYLQVKQKGTYLQMYWKGSWETLPTAYAQIMEYVYAHNIKLKGNIYEENVIDDFAVIDTNQFITKIMIAIES